MMRPGSHARRYLIPGGLALVGLGLLAITTAQGEITGPTPLDRQVTLMVAGILPQGHLTRHPLNDEMSQRALKVLLRYFDPQKAYFNQTDIAEFEKHANELDDMARRGDVSLAYTVYNRFLERVAQRVKFAEEWLAANHDFSVDEDLVIGREAVKYAANDVEAKELWRKRIKYDLLAEMAEKKSLEEGRDRLLRRNRSFEKRMRQIDQDELLEIFLTSVTSSYDPHTSYMSRDTLDNFDIMMKLQLDGIGAALEPEDGYTVVKEVVPGGPADKDGRLKPRDRVIGVGQGKDGEIEDVVDMKLQDVVKRIRGKRGTIVRLQVVSEGSSNPTIYEITRAAIELKDGEARSAIFEQGQKTNGEPYRIGVIDLPSFYMDTSGFRMHLENYKSTTRDVRKILDDFRSKHVDAVIMDLRRNGGGLLTEAVSLTSLFVDRGPIVQVKGYDGTVDQLDDSEDGTIWDGPLVVLISKMSASASEIFAGAIQDYGRGLIIGDRCTHGKGTVQTLKELGPELFKGANPPSMGALKITTNQFYRPNGDSTQNRGVLADVELPAITTYWDIGEADLDYALAFDRVPAAQYSKANLVDPAVVREIAAQSHRRVQASADFKKVLDNIATYKERKKRTTVSLNQAKFNADREALNVEETEKEAEKRPSGTGIQRDYYLDEALAIALDYARMIRVAQN